MPDCTFTILRELPQSKDFIDFRARCGWGRLADDAAQKTLKAGLVNVSVYDNDKMVGFGRVIGDGAIYFYVQDLIVDEAYRGQGLGALVMETLLNGVRNIASPGAVIGLMSAKGVDDFYKPFGFVVRPNEKFGAGMILEL